MFFVLLKWLTNYYQLDHVYGCHSGLTLNKSIDEVCMNDNEHCVFWYVNLCVCVRLVCVFWVLEPVQSSLFLSRSPKSHHYTPSSPLHQAGVFSVSVCSCLCVCMCIVVCVYGYG